jgi:hypothetical protein
MSQVFANPKIIERFDDLIGEAKELWEEFRRNEKGMIMDIVRFTRWATSSLNLLDKLSVSTNRFVSQFEIWVNTGPGKKMNIGAALGVLEAARNEYSRGLAVDYQLSVSAAVLGGLLDEASYLVGKGYNRAAAVLMGAALEEGLKARARAVPLEVGPKLTLDPLIAMLKAPDVHLLTDFESKRLMALARMRNDAAHGGDFNYNTGDVEAAVTEVEATLSRLLGGA